MLAGITVARLGGGHEVQQDTLQSVPCCPRVGVGEQYRRTAHSHHQEYYYWDSHMAGGDLTILAPRMVRALGLTDV